MAVRGFRQRLAASRPRIGIGQFAHVHRRLAALGGSSSDSVGHQGARFSIGGLLLQPYLVPIGLAFPFVLLRRITKFPVGPLIGWMVFVGIYAIASIGPATEMMDPLSENIKVLSAIISIVHGCAVGAESHGFIFGAAGWWPRGASRLPRFGRTTNWPRQSDRCGE